MSRLVCCVLDQRYLNSKAVNHFELSVVQNEQYEQNIYKELVHNK